jgi:polysaccharide biosynthesis/export protein
MRAGINTLSICLLAFIGCFVGLGCCAAWAQTADTGAVGRVTGTTLPTKTPNTAPLSNTPGPDTDSIISEDDVLEVYVMDVAELSRQYRVAPSGRIVVPLLPDPIYVAGMTPDELAVELGKELREKGLVTNPHIVVSIVSSRLKAVAITGAVKMPQIYPVFGRTTLLDLLSQAQGVSDDASNVAVITRGDLGLQLANTTDRVQRVDIKKLLDTGDPQYNIDIYPGDKVTVPHAGVVYVVGAVNKPGGFVIRAPDKGMTVLQALAMAEDAKSTAVRKKAMIIRQTNDKSGAHQQLPLNVDLILAGKQPDPLLMADDILFIPDSTAKKAFRRGAEAALQAATLAVVYRP